MWGMSGKPSRAATATPRSFVEGKSKPLYPAIQEQTMLVPYRKTPEVNSKMDYYQQQQRPLSMRSLNITTYPKFSLSDWAQSNMHYNIVAENAMQNSIKLRTESFNVIRNAQEVTRQGQKDVEKQLAERILNITHWKHELELELGKLEAESNTLLEAQHFLQKALGNTADPIRVAQDCLYSREKRQSIDLVHDDVENLLLDEISVIKKCKERMQELVDKMQVQLRVTRPTSWVEFSNHNIQQSQLERMASARLRMDADAMTKACATDIWVAYNNTNVSLTKRVAESLNAQRDLQTHLSKISSEQNEMETNVDFIKHGLKNKIAPLKLAQTRLEARLHRLDVELCHDQPHIRLVREVHELQSTIEELNVKLKQAETTLQNLVTIRRQLEQQLKVKANSIFIDREKCLGIRKTFPYRIAYW